jgi:acyl transferase domain-containing protein
VGDKIEAGAIAETFARDRTDDSPLYVGSVKTNVGHTESAAGLAGILKALLVLEKGVIPPNMNFAKANEAIPLEKWHIKVCTCLTVPKSPRNIDLTIISADSTEIDTVARKPNPKSFRQ